MQIIEIQCLIFKILFTISLLINCILFYYWRKELLRKEPITAKVYDFFRWVCVILIFILPVSEAMLKLNGIEIVLISDKTLEIFKQTLIYFVLPHMLYSIKDFIPEATEFLRVLKSNNDKSNTN